MQRKRKVVLFTLGVMLIAVVFICSWFRPEAVKERNLDFLKHEAAEFIREQSADNIFSYEKFESGEYRTYTCNINDVYISGSYVSKSGVRLFPYYLLTYIMPPLYKL